MQDNVTATEFRGWLLRIHTCVKEKGGYFEYKLMAFQFISDTVIFLLTCVKYLIINYQWLNLNYGAK